MVNWLENSPLTSLTNNIVDLGCGNAAMLLELVCVENCLHLFNSLGKGLCMVHSSVNWKFTEIALKCILDVCLHLPDFQFKGLSV